MSEYDAELFLLKRMLHLPSPAQAEASREEARGRSIGIRIDPSQNTSGHIVAGKYTCPRPALEPKAPPPALVAARHRKMLARAGYLDFGAHARSRGPR